MAMLAAAAPKRTSRAGGQPREKRRCCCVPSARASRVRGERSWLQPHPRPLATPLSPRGRRSRAEPSPGLDYAHRGLSSCSPASFGWLLRRPEGERRWCLCVDASERAREREPTRRGGRWRLGPTHQESFLPSRSLTPRRAPGRGPGGGDSGGAQPLHPPPSHLCSSMGGKLKKKKKSRAVLMSPANREENK